MLYCCFYHSTGEKKNNNTTEETPKKPDLVQVSAGCVHPHAEVTAEYKTPGTQVCGVYHREGPNMKRQLHLRLYLSGRVIPGLVGTIMGLEGGLIIGGPGIIGMCPPMGGLIPGAARG